MSPGPPGPDGGDGIWQRGAAPAFAAAPLGQRDFSVVFKCQRSRPSRYHLVGVVGFGGTGGPRSGNRGRRESRSRERADSRTRQPCAPGVAAQTGLRLVWTGPKWNEGSYTDLSVVRFGTWECVLRFSRPIQDLGVYVKVSG